MTDKNWKLLEGFCKSKGTIGFLVAIEKYHNLSDRTESNCVFLSLVRDIFRERQKHDNRLFLILNIFRLSVLNE